jgi:dienelactone hydrolase
MSTTILLIAFMVTAAFAVYTIITRSRQEKIKSMLRIAALAAFLLLALADVIQWDARWYPMAALLLIWAALGVWSLVRTAAEKRPFTVGRGLLGTLGTLLLVAVAVTPALIFPQYRVPAVTGSFQVASYTETYTDPNRIDPFSANGEKRFVNVECWYPADGAGSYPLVVFSHGSFGIRTSNISMYNELASHGYVVCSIDHPHHSMYTQDPNGRTIMVDRSFMQEVMDANTGKYDDRTDWELVQKWLRLRIEDMHFTLDTIQARASEPGSAAVYQMMDLDRIGLMGHSLGASAAAQLGRERAGIDAVVDLDADLLGDYVDFIDGQEVVNGEPYPVPLLIIYSDDMMRVIAKNDARGNTIASRKVTASTANTYEIHLAGTNHLSLTDLSLTSPFLVSMINSMAQIGGGEEADPLEVLEELNSIVLKFFDVYLKGEGIFLSEGS